MIPTRRYYLWMVGLDFSLPSRVSTKAQVERGRRAAAAIFDLIYPSAQQIAAAARKVAREMFRDAGSTISLGLSTGYTGWVPETYDRPQQYASMFDAEVMERALLPLGRPPGVRVLGALNYGASLDDRNFL